MEHPPDEFEVEPPAVPEAVTSSERSLDTEAPAASVAVTVKLFLLALLGVPLMVPVAESIESPGGKDPDEIAHVMVGVPPATLRVWLYSLPL